MKKKLTTGKELTTLSDRYETGVPFFGTRTHHWPEVSEIH